jgi:hypothetical protein
MFFMWLEQNGIGGTFLGTFGAADAQIVDLVTDQALAFARGAFSVEVGDVFFAEIF